MGSPLSGDDYALITKAASTNSAAKATIDFYEEWTANARANPDLLVHLEAMTYDPAYESTPQFDAVAVLIAMDIARGNPSARVLQEEFANGVHFVTNEDAADAKFEDDPKPAFSLWTGNEKDTRSVGVGKCKALTPYTFDRDSVKEDPVPIKAALGFVSNETEAGFFREMATRMAGSTMNEEDIWREGDGDDAFKIGDDNTSVEVEDTSSSASSASVSVMLLTAFAAFLN